VEAKASKSDKKPEAKEEAEKKKPEPKKEAAAAPAAAAAAGGAVESRLVWRQGYYLNNVWQVQLSSSVSTERSEEREPACARDGTREGERG
jgi:hypothetical protein